jgi:glycosyltransferase involved in cell wall biosynthesis
VTLSLLALTRHCELGASNRQRILIYRAALEQAGFAVTVVPFFDHDYLVARYASGSLWGSALRAFLRFGGRPRLAREFDLVLIEKEVAPWLPGWIDRATLGGVPYVLDYDDAWFLRYREHGSAIVRATMGRKLEGLARRSALTIAGNDYLARWANDSGARSVLTIPTVVDCAHYPVRPEPAEPFTVGWVGTPLTAKYVDSIAGPLRSFCRDYGARLMLVGANEPCGNGLPCISVPWHRSDEAENLARCHVGIMPLADDEWSRGKCGYKLIQYMACGRPVIASAVGVNPSIVEHGRSGFLVHTPEEWYRALVTLHDDPGLRRTMGAAGRRRVEQTYCTEATIGSLIAGLRAAAGRS